MLDVRDGALTGSHADAQCVRAEKARRVRERYDLAAFARVHASHTRTYRWQPQAA